MSQPPPSSPDDHAFTLRPPTSADAKTLAQAFAAIDPWLRYGFTAAAIETFLTNREPNAPCFAVYHGERLAGAAILRTVWLRGPYLQFLGVLPEHQNKGVGGFLLRWLESTARNNSDRNLWVATSSFNDGARRFYERHGFIYVATLPDLIADGIAEILLRKKL